MTVISKSSGFDCHRFVSRIRDQGVVLAIDEGQLRLWGPEAVLDDSSVATIREFRSQIIDFLGDQGSGQGAGIELIESCPEAEHRPFALTDIQRAYWVGRQQTFKHGDVAIHYYTEIACKDLDPDRLRLAWNRTVRHHGMLRAVVDETAMQRILPEVPDYEIAITDLSGRSEADRRAALQAHRQAMSHHVHRTDCWPGFDLQLFRLSQSDWLLSYSQDLLHIDGGSLLIVINDFCRWYQTPALEKAVPGLSFRDYAIHEEAQKHDERYRIDLDYWREVVSALPPPPALPRGAAASAAGRFVRHSFELDADAYTEIRRQAAAMHITPTAYVMTAFADVVSLWNGSQDFTLNVTVFNRPSLHPDIDRIAGDFTSMMPMACRRADGATLSERAAVMQGILWKHVEHRRVSGVTVLELLRKAAGEQAAAELTVVFTSLLGLANQGFSSDYFSALGETCYTVTQTPQVTLDHQVAESPSGGISFSWDVVEEAFPEGLIAAAFSAFEHLMRRLVRDPNAWRDANLDHLPAVEKRLFDAVNDTARAWPAEQTLRDLIYQRAAMQPERPALVAHDCRLDYAGLIAASERLADRLIAAGVSPGERVGILMHKGWAQPVAAIAAHVAAAAYVPIDPTIPAQRLAQILEDASIAVLMLDSSMAALCPEVAATRVLVDGSLLENGTRAEARPLTVDALSHVIYTSGSTGRPKGVLITHGNVVPRMLDINERFEIAPGDAILGLSALYHDLSVYDIFGIFAAGAKLVLPREEERLDPACWCSLMSSEQVTLWNSVPTFAGMLVDYLEGHPEAADGIVLRWMILAGDWIPVPLPQRLKAIRPGLDFIASGGPTETTIWDIWNRVDQVDPSWPSIPYGKPLANAAYYILDNANRRCPIWVAGELFIGGTGVTQGYLNQPELTAQKYVNIPGIDGRLFKSGDMGRYLPDGSIEFLGRNDLQVKVNGQRIELGEIERVALEVPGVKACASVVQTTEQGPALALFFTAVAAGVSEVDISAQQAAFAEHGVLSDPVERLSGKLAYRALSPQPGAQLLRLTPTKTQLPALKSYREFLPGTIAMSEFVEFFAPLRGHRDPNSGEAKFQYGSAGGLYPVQIFVYVKPDAVESLPAGIYRYYPLEHALEQISERILSDDIHWPHNRPMGVSASFFVYLVADLSVIGEQYGEAFAEPMSAIEAGMLSQRLRHAVHETGFGVCSVGDIGFAKYADAFGLGEQQKLLTSMVAGRVHPEQAVPAKALIERIREALVEQLPPHMVPAAIRELPTLPLTANEKVDRRALAEMDVGAVAARHEHVAPKDAFEETVATLLADMLGVERVGVTDNFFDLGASSALIITAYHRIIEETGAAFPLIDLFRYPTVRRLSESLRSSGDGDHSATTTRADKQKQALDRVRKMRRGG
jgi:epothilone synthetase B